MNVIACATEVLAKPEAFHPSEEGRLIGEYILKRAMRIAYFTHEDATCLFNDLRLNDARHISKIGDTDVTLDHSLDCCSIAIGAE